MAACRRPRSTGSCSIGRRARSLCPHHSWAPATAGFASPRRLISGAVLLGGETWAEGLYRRRSGGSEALDVNDAKAILHAVGSCSTKERRDGPSKKYLRHCVERAACSYGGGSLVERGLRAGKDAVAKLASCASSTQPCSNTEARRQQRQQTRAAARRLLPLLPPPPPPPWCGRWHGQHGRGRTRGGGSQQPHAVASSDDPAGIDGW